MAISPYWIKSDGTAGGQGLARKVTDFIAARGIAGRVPALVTDCEPSMMKAGRELESNDVAEHYGYAAHRGESSAGRVFVGKRIEEMMARCPLHGDAFHEIKLGGGRKAQHALYCIVKGVKANTKNKQDMPTP